MRAIWPNCGRCWSRLTINEECRLQRRTRFPKGTVWVKPELVAQIKFANWTDDKKLRAPVYLGLRDDKPSTEVSREEVAPPRFLPLDKKEVTTESTGTASSSRISTRFTIPKTAIRSAIC